MMRVRNVSGVGCGNGNGSRPFFALPKLKGMPDANYSRMATGTDLIQNTANGSGMTTWPLKVEKRKKSCKRPPRPRTATLERPTLLDIAFLEKVDMSLVRKELLNISNLCRPSARKRTQENIRINPRRNASLSMQHLKVPKSDESWKGSDRTVLTNNRKNARFRDLQDSDSSPLMTPKYRTDSNFAIAVIGASSLSPRSHLSASTARTTTTAGGFDSDSDISTVRKGRARNRLTRKTPREVFSVPHLKQHIPEPCRTCGRNDLPERFHSHARLSTNGGTSAGSNPTRSRLMKSWTANNGPKSSSDSASSVATPRASPRFCPPRGPNRSRKFIKSADESIRVGNRLAKSQPVQQQTNLQVSREVKPKSIITHRRPRTLTCYLCGKEFGTASLHLHEPKCLQRWERENAYLPAHLRRPLPEKPPAHLSALEYNNLAWKVSQKSLLPCSNCGRTFLPERLEIHQRSCKLPRHQKQMQKDPSDTSASLLNPAIVKCIVCDRAISARSLAQHEAQCLASWRRRNELLPEAERRPEPSRRRSTETVVDEITAPSSKTSDVRSSKSPCHRVTPRVENKAGDGKTNSTGGKNKPLQLQRWRKPKPPPRPWTLECYLCGVELPTSEINAHEEMCLEDWRRHNELLPKDKREKEPPKPDMRFTDITSGAEANPDDAANSYWLLHLRQLLPCKHCGRTFNPDRLPIHEKSCLRQKQ